MYFCPFLSFRYLSYEFGLCPCRRACMYGCVCSEVLVVVSAALHCTVADVVDALMDDVDNDVTSC